ncbi:uncharacterized protein GJ701_015400 isoform 1-T1 [Geothlypis trichas]
MIFTMAVPACVLLIQSGLWAQLRLQEAGGGQRAPGDSVTLSCRGSGFTFEDYYIYWYRQFSGGSLEWVSFISSPKGTVEDYGAAVKDRANMSRDNSRSEAYLSLRSLQAQDSARYFCAISRGQETQKSFNTNLSGPAEAALDVGKVRVVRGRSPMGLKTVSKKSGAGAVHHRYSWPLLHTAGLLIWSRTVSNYKLPYSHSIPVAVRPILKAEFLNSRPLLSKKKRDNKKASMGSFLSNESLIFISTASCSLPPSGCSPMASAWVLPKSCCPSESTLSSLSSLGSPQAPPPQCHDQTVRVHLQARRLQEVPEQPVSVFGHPHTVKKHFSLMFSENLMSFSVCAH